MLFADDSTRPLSIDVSNVPISTITLPWVRHMIRNSRKSETEGRTLRFILKGRLANAADFATEIRRFLGSGVGDGNISDTLNLHCVIGVDQIGGSGVDADQRERMILAEEQKDDEGRRHLGSGDGDSGETMGAIGFDRLRSVGFTDEEIALLRAQFRATYGDLESRRRANELDELDNGDEVEGDNEDNLEFGEGTADTMGLGNNNAPSAGGRPGETDIRELEEQWMENGVGDNDERFNSVPIANYQHNKDLLIGIAVGFCFGIFSIILMKFDGLFNRRQKMSMFAGIIVNMIFCLFRGMS